MVWLLDDCYAALNGSPDPGGKSRLAAQDYAVPLGRWN